MSAFNSKGFLNTVTSKPGVYQMFDDSNTVIYVGKARNLKKRLSSYFNQSANQSPKTKALVAQIAQINVTVTHTETEALILENNLIKTYQPRYNILLRDDKSYPYIYLSNHEFPRLSFHRGAKKGKGRYFGPYPSAKAVYESLNLMQKLFPIRQCQDSFFRNRARPCLQYQIKRCTAPCVGLVAAKTYQEDVEHATLFLDGKSDTVITHLQTKMQTAAKALEYETAAKYRDQITSLRRVQERQYISTDGGDIDIVASVVNDGIGCVQVLSVRDGRHLGSRAFFPKHTQEASAESLLVAFLPQYYLADKLEMPTEILLSHDLAAWCVAEEAVDDDLLTHLQTVFSQHSGRSVQIRSQVRATRARWVAMALENAEVSLAQRQPSEYRERLAVLSTVLHLDALPKQIECFDISHTSGEATVAACVVFGDEGAISSAFRRFDIHDITPGDDYAAMRQALQKRYARLQKDQAVLPDIVLIDGGSKQVTVAVEVLQTLALQETIRIIGVAKGAGRKAGLEKLVLPDEENPLLLPKDSPALLLIQHIRDEAHRYAITGHRSKRAKARQVSVLENIEGIGAKRRQQLIQHFGGLQGVMRAGVEDLSRVPGISRELAQKIYDFFVST